MLPHARRAAASLLVRRRSLFLRFASTDAFVSPPLHVAVVGSGPAGMYVTSSLLKKLGDGVRVDVIDKLPTPYGLVRSGVAPDHADTKNVTNQFERTLSDARVGFWGGVRVAEEGEDDEARGGGAPSPPPPSPPPITVDALRRAYHAVVLAHGAESDASLVGVPGGRSERAPLSGVLSARDFVLWVNGHPDRAGLGLDLSTTRSAVVVGLGNVALDCARLLLRSPSDLASTDAALPALRALSRSAVRSVHILARRGPAQAACTAAELREALNLPGVRVAVHPSPLPSPPAPDDESDLAKRGRGARRVYGLLADASVKAFEGGAADGKELHLHFYRAPAAYRPSSADPSSVGGVALRITDRTGRQASDEQPTLPADLVLEAVGFRTRRLAGVPWNAASRTVPAGAGGRVMFEGGENRDTAAPLYVSGWARRGPSGIIGSNAADGADVAAAVVEDAAQRGLLQNGGGGSEQPSPLAALLAGRPPAVTAAGWRAIDEAERAAAESRPDPRPPRVKLTDVREMVSVAERVDGGTAVG